MSQAIKLLPDTLRSIGFASISSSYMGIGTAFNHPIRIIHLQNLTDGALMFSFDGIEDQLVLPRNGFLLVDVCANKTTESGFFIAEGTRVYVKELDNPTSGNVYLSAFYGYEV